MSYLSLIYKETANKLQNFYYIEEGLIIELPIMSIPSLQLFITQGMWTFFGETQSYLSFTPSLSDQIL